MEQKQLDETNGSGSGGDEREVSGRRRRAAATEASHSKGAHPSLFSALSTLHACTQRAPYLGQLQSPFADRFGRFPAVSARPTMSRARGLA